MISIVNAAGSSLARESDEVLTLNCGPEVGVAATKSFTAQVMVGNVIADAVVGKSTVGDMATVRRLIEETLATEERVREIAKLFRDRPDFYFIARGHHYPLALEGALKLKELSYIHAEGMPASELKHGTLALIEKGTPVVVLAPGGEGFESTISNALELEARGAEVIGSRTRSTRSSGTGWQSRRPTRASRRYSRSSPSSSWRTSWRPRGRTTRLSAEPRQVGHREVVGRARRKRPGQTKINIDASDGRSCKTGKRYLTAPEKSIEVGKKSISKLLEEMAQTGFQGKRLGEAARIWAEMTQQKGLTIFMGYSGSMSTTGQWKIVRWLIENRYIDVLVSTGANISEDILEAMGYKYYQGTWLANDEELLEAKIDRFYDIYADEYEYRELEGLIRKVREHAGHKEVVLDEGVPQQVR